VRGARVTRLDDRELSMMDSRVRRLSQRAIELRAFRKMLDRANIDLRGKHLLDANCGNGFGLELLAKAFRPARLVGFDLVPEQIERAKRRRLDAEIAVGDITNLAHPDATFDGAFVFGILHHVVEWRPGVIDRRGSASWPKRSALRELVRVLKPGGVLLVEEIHGRSIEDKVIGTSHPPGAAFDWPQFMNCLAIAGLTIVGDQKLVGGAIRSFAAVKR
jgi:ubiquinone/menaquinone biosynthesis C-methylase UbiE